MEKPETSIVVVTINADPVCTIVDFIAFTLSFLEFNSFLYRNKKCKLSSTAIPRATAKVIAVGGLIEISSNAKMPSIVNIGIRLVTRLANKIDFALNINAITMLIKKSAIPKLSINDCTM